MSIEKVRQYFSQFQMEHKIIEPKESSATVEEAARAVGCEPARIAKTLSFLTQKGPVLVVTAGDAKIDNRKYKETFSEKARMIPGSQVEECIGHAPGGVCPFAVNEGVPVFLDISLKRFETIYPAAGSGNSAIELTPEELWRYSPAEKWVDVCKNWI